MHYSYTMSHLMSERCCISHIFVIMCYVDNEPIVSTLLSLYNRVIYVLHHYYMILDALLLVTLIFYYKWLEYISLFFFSFSKILILAVLRKLIFGIITHSNLLFFKQLFSEKTQSKQ